MKLRCKSGDMAIIIYDTPECSSNIGRVVEVRGPVQVNKDYWTNAHCWLIKSVHKALFKVEYEHRGKRVVVPKRCTWKNHIEHPDAWMIPIRPTDDDLDLSDAEELIKNLMKNGIAEKKILLIP